jgi:hypothetical protein
MGNNQMNKQADIAYAAGLFDGEGCVRIRRLRREDRRGGIEHMLLTEICNTHLKPIEWLIGHFGGRVYRSSYADKRGYKPLWRWTITGARAKPFLELIKPYTKIKEPQIAVALEFQEGLSHGKPWGMTQEELDRREDCAKRLSELKR